VWSEAAKKEFLNVCNARPTSSILYASAAAHVVFELSGVVYSSHLDIMFFSTTQYVIE
jgi:hypothetical protein